MDVEAEATRAAVTWGDAPVFPDAKEKQPPTREEIERLWQEVLNQFSLNHWKGEIEGVPEKYKGATSEIQSNCEYLTYTLRVDPQAVLSRGHDLRAILEHEAMHLVFSTYDWIANRMATKYISDERAREFFVEQVELMGHQVLETIHRAFNAKVH